MRERQLYIGLNYPCWEADGVASGERGDGSNGDDKRSSTGRELAPGTIAQNTQNGNGKD